MHHVIPNNVANSLSKFLKKNHFPFSKVYLSSKKYTGQDGTAQKFRTLWTIFDGTFPTFMNF
jgi:hypothetical protein